MDFNKYFFLNKNKYIKIWKYINKWLYAWWISGQEYSTIQLL